MSRAVAAVDNEGTLARLKALRRTLFDPKIAEHHGHRQEYWGRRIAIVHADTWSSANVE
jgi:hypothetical protein